MNEKWSAEKNSIVKVQALREEIEKGTLKMEDLKRSAARVVNCVWNCSALL
jgi:anti-sigma28 factor (negative regulator of flagellin synthesis)